MSLQFWKSEHSRARGLLSPYIDGRLSEQEKVRLEAHLKGCPKCEMEMASLRQTVAALRSLPSVALPRSFALTQASGQGSWMPPRPLVWAMQASTGVAALLLTLVLAGDFLQATAPSADPVDRMEFAPSQAAAPAPPPAPAAAPAPQPKGFAAPAAAPVPAPTSPASADASALRQAQDTAGAAEAKPAAPTPMPEQAPLLQAEPGPAEPRGFANTRQDALRAVELFLGAVVIVLGGITAYLMLRRRQSSTQLK